MFVDEAVIQVVSGKGGNGVVHFRKEKYVPRGGPDGGDGGTGGDIVLVVNTHLNTLYSFRKQRIFRAENGVNGGGKNQTGKSAEALEIKIPPGTLVYDDKTGELIVDMLSKGQEFVVARGGHGGRGNARFASSRNQAPRMAEKGEPGVERQLRLELKLLADIGIVGMPNAGKSTFLAAVTNARPKIAGYPFTTLTPNLGVAELDDDIQLVLADIPGLIEGAHEGQGLGFQFLRHIQRTRVLIHMIDGGAKEPLLDYSQILSELALFDPTLGTKPQVVVLNKIDQPEVADRLPQLEQAFKAKGQKVFSVSALAHKNLRPVLWEAHRFLQMQSVEEQVEEIPIYRPEADPEFFTVGRDMDGVWRVEGEAVERATAMTYWEYEEAVRRFQRMLREIGIEKALADAGAKTGDFVRIGEYEFEWMA